MATQNLWNNAAMFGIEFNWFARRKKLKVSSFVAIKTKLIAEFRGTLAQTTYAIHHFYCAKLSIAQGVTLATPDHPLPTHLFYCVCYLMRAPHQPRLVFSTAVMLLNDMVAKSIASDLYKSLVKADRVFLVRCQNKREFPWCVAETVFDQFWDTEFKVFYKLRNRKSDF